MAAYRLTRRALGRWPSFGRVAGALLAPFAVAFLETALNANPWMKSLFCYDDTTLALTFGSLAYGLAFVVALPVWMAIDETEDARLPLSRVLLFTLLAVIVDTLLLHLLRVASRPTSPLWSRERTACATSARAASKEGHRQPMHRSVRLP